MRTSILGETSTSTRGPTRRPFHAPPGRQSHPQLGRATEADSQGWGPAKSHGARPDRREYLRQHFNFYRLQWIRHARSVQWGDMETSGNVRRAGTLTFGVLCTIFMLTIVGAVIVPGSEGDPGGRVVAFLMAGVFLFIGYCGAIRPPSPFRGRVKFTSPTRFSTTTYAADLWRS